MVADLYRSRFCRLCGDRSKNGVSLYDENLQLHVIVNRYLPIKVEDDGIYPTTICPGCRIQLEDTSLFIDTIIKGQLKLKQLQYEEEKKDTDAECENSRSFPKTVDLFSPSLQKENSIVDNVLSPSALFYTKGLRAIEEPKSLLFEPESLINAQESSAWVDDFFVHPDKRTENISKVSELVTSETKDNLKSANSFECEVSDVMEKEDCVQIDITPTEPNSQLSDAHSLHFNKGLIQNDSSVLESLTYISKEEEKLPHSSPLEFDDSLVAQNVPLEAVSNTSSIVLPNDLIVTEEQISDALVSEAQQSNSAIVISDLINSVPVKRKRGRPRKYSFSNQLAQVSNQISEAKNQEVMTVQPLGTNLVSSENVSFESCETVPPPKRKRGRPSKKESLAIRKQLPPPSPSLEVRSTRVRKPPIRFSGLVEGKELDKALKDIGAIHEDEESQSVEAIYSEKLHCQTTESSEKVGKILTCDSALLGYITTLVKGHLVKSVFTCDGCDGNFQRFNQFLSHKSQGMCGLFECFRCRKLLSCREEKESHEGNCQGDSLLKWLCPMCLDSFHTLADLQHHSMLAHNLQKCPYCKKKFLLRRNLESHVFKVHPKNKISYRCQHCEKEYINLPSVLYHEEREHNTYLYQCLKCDKCFNHRQLLVKHQVVHANSELTHPEDQRFACQWCERVLRSSSTLRAHLKVHEAGQEFFCDVCLSAFKYKKSLTIHMRSHTGEKPYQCAYCPKAFKQKGNLKEHLRIHSGERPHQCSHCQSAFKTSSQLRCHLMLHSGNKPFSCSSCFKRFPTKDGLEIHNRRHKGERPFSCAVCSKAFVDLNSLKKHLRIHSGERPFSCQICDRAFSDCSNLKKHIKNVHKQPSAPNVATSAETLYLDLNQIPTDQLTDLRLDDLDTGVNEQSDSLCLAISTTQSQLEKIEALNGLGDSSRKIVTDELGVPLKVTLADGSQLQVTTMDGESLQVVTSDGVPIPVKLNVEGLDQLTTLESLNVDVNSSLTEYNIGDDYGIHFVTDEGQDIRILPGSFSVSTLKWDLPS